MPFSPQPRWILPGLVLLCVAFPVALAWPAAALSWRGLGVITAWSGVGLILASLLLMQREVRLARLLGGLERMYGWHHHLGVLGYVCLLAHPLLLAAAQPQTGRAWQVLWPPVEHALAGLIWSGWAALCCLMLGLALALLPAQWLRYELWRRLHGLLGLAVLLLCVHLWCAELPLWYWAIPLLMLALLLWRVLRADVGYAAHAAQVTAVHTLAQDAVEVTLKLAHGPRPGMLAGQFVLVAFHDGPGYRGCREFHPFTLSAVLADGQLCLGIKALGNCTRGMQDLCVGVAARVQGPFGRFLPPHTEGPALWLAGGIGITPFIAALRAGAPRHAVRLIYLHRDASDAAYVEELQQLAGQLPHFELQIVMSGAQLADLASLLPTAQELCAPEAEPWHCWLCGPPGLVDHARRLLRQRGVARAHIHYERFDFR